MLSRRDITRLTSLHRSSALSVLLSVVLLSLQASSQDEVAVDQDAVAATTVQVVQDMTTGQIYARIESQSSNTTAAAYSDGSFSLAPLSDQDGGVFLTPILREHADAEAPLLNAPKGSAVVRTGGLSQFFTPTERGVAHLLVVDEPATVPDDSRADLVLRFATTGYSPTLTSYNSISFSSVGHGAITYSGLLVFDGLGRAQDASFDVDGSDVLILVTLAEDATWPLTIDPIAQSSVLHAGSTAGWRFGGSTATGDFNNDGYADVLFGEEHYTNGHTQEGRGRIYFGASGGLTTSGALSFEPNLSSSKCGRTVAVAKLNGDAYDDILIGCPGEDGGRGTIRVHLNLGASPWFSTTPSVVFNVAGTDGPYGLASTNIAVFDIAGGTTEPEVISATQNKLFTFRVSAGSGPVTAAPNHGAFSSGVAPTVAALRFSSPNSETGVLVGNPGRARYFPPHSTLGYPDPSNSVYYPSTAISSTLAQIAVGDPNGDDFMDFYLGFPEPTANDSAGYYYHNSGGTFASPNIIYFLSEDTGRSVAFCDVNKDGRDDFILCHQNAPSGDLGRCSVFASINGFSISNDTKKLDAYGGAGAELGHAARQISCGDVRKDGARDLILPQPLNSSEKGAFEIYDGKLAGLRMESYFVFSEPDLAYTSLGYSVVMSDLNSDGYDDVIVGAPEWDSSGTSDDRGAVFVYMGGPSMSSEPVAAYFGQYAGERFGEAIAVARLRGSTYPPSLIVGAPLYNDTRGRVVIFNAPSSGFPDTTPDSPTLQGSTYLGYFGRSVANAGSLMNLNGDSLAVGAPGGKTVDGNLFIYKSTGSSGLSSTPTYVVSGNSVGCPYGTFSQGLSNPGNIEGTNSRDDLLVSSPLCTNGQTEEGKVFLYHSTGSRDTMALSSWSYEPNQAYATASAVAGVGDFNGDGILDFAVGVPNYNYSSTITQSGRVVVFSGSTTGTPSSTPIWTFTNSRGGDKCGISIAGGVDLNFDGVDDMVVGCPGHSPSSGANQGKVVSFHGGYSAASKNGHETACGIAGCSLGSSVSVGHLNGDSYGDSAWGAPGYTNGQTREGNVRVRIGQW